MGIGGNTVGNVGDLVRIIDPDPAAHQSPHLVNGARCVFIVGKIEMPQVFGDAHAKPHPLQRQIGTAQTEGTFTRHEGSFDQVIGHGQRLTVKAVPKQKFLTAREFFDCGHQPENQLIARFKRWAGGTCRFARRS